MKLHLNMVFKDNFAALKSQSIHLFNILCQKLFIDVIFIQLTQFTHPRMLLFCMQGNVHISVLNGALWDMEQVHSGIYETGLLAVYSTKWPYGLCLVVTWY